jgi:hypothetical protein
MLARKSADRSTYHSDRLAPESLRLELETEVAAPAGKTKRGVGDS